MRESSGKTTLILADFGKIMGLNESEWGQIGVKAITSVLGWIMLPPHERLYAVEPVGVDISKPSP